MLRLGRFSFDEFVFSSRQISSVAFSSLRNESFPLVCRGENKSELNWLRFETKNDVEQKTSSEFALLQEENFSSSIKIQRWISFDFCQFIPTGKMLSENSNDNFLLHQLFRSTIQLKRKFVGRKSFGSNREISLSMIDQQENFFTFTETNRQTRRFLFNQLKDRFFPKRIDSLKKFSMEP